MVEYKTPGEIDAMHAAGQVLARRFPGSSWPGLPPLVGVLVWLLR